MRDITFAVFAIGFALFIPARGLAQSPEPDPSTTFADLALRLPAESSVIVTDQQGRRITGRLIGIKQDVLSVRTERALTLRQAEVQLVQRKVPDSTLDGGFLGFAIGMIVPMAICMTRSDSSETPSCVLGSVAFGGLPGLAIGAIVDSHRGRKVTLFRSTAPVNSFVRFDAVTGY